MKRNVFFAMVLLAAMAAASPVLAESCPGRKFEIKAEQKFDLPGMPSGIQELESGTLAIRSQDPSIRLIRRLGLQVSVYSASTGQTSIADAADLGASGLVIGFLGDSGPRLRKITETGALLASGQTLGQVYDAPVSRLDGTLAVVSTDSAANLSWLQIFDKDLAPVGEPYKIPGTSFEGPVAQADGSLLLVSGYGALHRIDPQGVGREIFRISGMGTARHTPLVLPDGSMVLAADDKKVYFLNPDGSLRNTYVGENTFIYQPVLLQDGRVMAQDETKVLLFDQDGAFKSVLVEKIREAFVPPVQLGDGTIVVSAQYGRELRFFSPSGELKGMIEEDDLSFFAPKAYGPDAIMVASRTTGLRFYGSDSKLLGEYPDTQSAVLGAGPLALSDGRVAHYVGDQKELHILGITERCEQPIP